MAKTKHQKLADKMQAMMVAIDEHSAKVAGQLNLVQLHFYEPYALFGRPLMTESALRGMFVTHYLCLQNLAADPLLRTTCGKFPMLGTIIKRPIYLKSECRQSSGEGKWFVPWKVQLMLPLENQSKLKRSRGQALLYCPDPCEMSNHIDWFEHEMAADSLTHQLLSFMESERHKSIVRKNLNNKKAPHTAWKSAKETWQASPAEESAPDQIHHVAVNPRDVDTVDFAPQHGDTLAIAYERVLESIAARACRHRQPLRKIYKKALENAMFIDVPWSDRHKVSFLLESTNSFFKAEQPPKPTKPGRWPQCEGVDDVTASQFIEHFITSFIANPNNKKLGEIACVLWILVWMAQEGEGDRFTIKQVLQLTSLDIVPDDAAVLIEGDEVGISWGLQTLLFCLRGKGEGKRAHRLFANLDVTGKTLERAMLDASKELLPADAKPVLPAAFLVSPSVLPGTRTPSAERGAVRNIKPIVPFHHTRTEIKKALLDAKKRQHLQR